MAPVALELAEALREEVEARQTDNGAARAETPLAEAVRADSDTLPAYRAPAWPRRYGWTGTLA